MISLASQWNYIFILILPFSFILFGEIFKIKPILLPGQIKLPKRKVKTKFYGHEW